MPTPPPTQPQLKLDIYHVWLVDQPDDDPETATYHRVVVTLDDQLRAERELARQGVKFSRFPMRSQSVMLWAALNRTGAVPDELAGFSSRVVQYLPDDRVKRDDPDTDEDGDEDEDVIHPTAASTS